MKIPFVSLVVVNYNGEGIIAKCLSSLVKVNYPKNKYELIVVDNSSTDDSISIIEKFPKVKIIQNKDNEGYVGVNSCLSKVKGKYIFILNNDLEMGKNCLRKLVDVIEEDNSIGMVAPKLINYYKRNVRSGGTWVSRAFYNGHFAETMEEKAKEIPYLGVGIVRTSIAKKFGYIYDPDYFIYAEDLDLGLRLRLIGYKTVYVPDAVIYHMHSVTMMKESRHKNTFLLEKNLLMTFFKILSLKNMIIFLPYVSALRLFAIAKDMLTLHVSSAFARFKAIAWLIFNANSIYKKRKETQKFRKADDSYILKVFSEKYIFKPKFII